MAYCPIGFITGQTGKNVKALLNHSQMLFKQANQRISTGQLNKLVKIAMEKHEPPLYQLKRPKVYYATQVSAAPPTIVLVCNNPQGIPAPYQRYLLGFLRDHLPFGEIPIRLFLQARKRDDERDDLGGSEETGNPSFTVDGEVYEMDPEDDFEEEELYDEFDDESEEELLSDDDSELDADDSEFEDDEEIVNSSESLDEESVDEDFEDEFDADYEDLEIESEPPTDHDSKKTP
jgi:GTP-binding protein